MKAVDMDRYISDLETLRFGFRVARMDSFNGPVNQIIEMLKQNDFKLIISRVPANDISLINEMENSGFQIRDIQVTHNFDLKQKPELQPGEVDLERKFSSSDTDALVEIARHSFENYGHYSRSKLTNWISTGEIYADWARRCCEDNNIADQIIVARINDKAAGFLCFKIRSLTGKKFAVGVMGAVDQRFRKEGVFKKINIAGLKWAWDKKLDRVEHNVLLSNIAVNKVYTSINFHIIRSEVTLYWEDMNGRS